MPGEAPMGVPAELTAKIRNLVEAREKTRSAIEDLKRQRKTTEGDWVQALANEAVTRGINFDGLVSKHKEATALEGRLNERISAAEFFLNVLDKQLEPYRRKSTEAVVYFLKEMVRQLSEKREVQEKGKGYLNARIENLLREVKELEPHPQVATRSGKSQA
jgi:hypothetical protein